MAKQTPKRDLGELRPQGGELAIAEVEDEAPETAPEQGETEALSVPDAEPEVAGLPDSEGQSPSGPTPEGQEAEEPEEVPTIVESYLPELADVGEDGKAVWHTLSTAQQEAMLRSLQRQLDRGSAADEQVGGDAGTKGEPQPEGTAAQPQHTAPAVRPAQPLEQPRLPDEALPPERINALLDRIGLDSSAPEDKEAAETLRAALVGGQEAIRYVRDLGAMIVRVLDEQGQEVHTLKDERQFESALESHARDIEAAGVRSVKDYEALADEAQKLKRAGRTKTWMDAVALALLDRRNGPLAKRAAPRARLQQKEAERIAASLATRRGRKGAQARPPAGGSFRDIARFHAKQAGMDVD